MMPVRLSYNLFEVPLLIEDARPTFGAINGNMTPFNDGVSRSIADAQAC